MPVAAFGHTDIGKVRKTNEDDYLCLNLGGQSAGKSSSLYLAAVADGMGGHAGGEVASALAMETLKERFARTAEEAVPGTNHLQKLKTCLEEINGRIYHRASQEEQYIGMGSTLVAALVGEHEALVANVGDCRAYRFRDRRWLQITRDHNWREEQLLAKNLTEKEILQSPLRNLVTRSLGFEEKVEVDTFKIDIQAGDHLLLCSDGLYKSLAERQMTKIFKGKRAPDKICQRLIRTACRKAGHDNITAVVLQVREGNAKKKARFCLSDTARITDSSYRKES
jgi:serine/threonine protein phosphatase PrpC